MALIDESIALHAVASAAFCAKSATPQPLKISENGTATAIDFRFMKKQYCLLNRQIEENVQSKKLKANSQQQKNFGTLQIHLRAKGNNSILRQSKVARSGRRVSMEDSKDFIRHSS